MSPVKVLAPERRRAPRPVLDTPAAPLRLPVTTASTLGEPVMTVPAATAVVVAVLIEKPMPGESEATRAPVGMFVPVMGMPTYQPLIVPV